MIVFTGLQGQQPARQLVDESREAIQRSLDAGLSPQHPVFRPDDRGVDDQSGRRAHDASQEDLAGSQRLPQPYRHLRSESRALGGRSLIPHAHDGAGVRRSQPALAGELRGQEIHHPFPKEVQVSCTRDPEGKHGHHFRVQAYPVLGGSSLGTASKKKPTGPHYSPEGKGYDSGHDGVAPGEDRASSGWLAGLPMRIWIALVNGGTRVWLGLDLLGP